MLHSVQLLRAAAAIAVVLFHTQLGFAEEGIPLAFALESYLFAFGAVGVHVFFIISGLVMVITSYGEPFSPYRFLRRRALRIYPIYWICAVLYIVAYALIGEGYELTLGQWVGALLLFPEDSSLIIGPGWTLAYEIFFYFAFALAMTVPGLTRRVSQTGALVLLAALFLGAIALGVLLAPEGALLRLMTNILLIEFLAGTAIGWMIVTNRLPLRWGGAILAAALAIYAGFIVVGYDMTTRVVTMGAASFLLVLGVICLERRYGASPLLQRLGRFGDSSYALYLIHLVIIALLLRLTRALDLGDMLEPAVVAALVILPQVAAAELLHRKVERPLLRWLNPKRSLVPERKPTETVEPAQ